MNTKLTQLLSLQGLSRTAACLSCAFGLAILANAQTIAKVSISPASVVGGTAATGTVTISPKAGANGVSIFLNSSSESATVSETVSIAKGKTSATFGIKTVPVGADSQAKIGASLGESSASATLTIKAPTLTSFALSPTSIAGGKSVTGTIKISSAAPTSGLQVKLASNQSSVTAPANITVAAGAKSGTGTIETSPVATKTTAKVTATLGSSSIGIALTVTPPTLTGLKLNPTSVSGGSQSTGTVSLSGPAPDAGFPITLTSSNKTVTLPSKVTVGGGASGTTFTISTASVKAKTTSTLTAKAANSVTATLTVTVAANSPFAGTYAGSFYTPSDPDMGGLNITISNSGALTGTATDIFTGGTSTLTGSVDGSGNTNLKIVTGTAVQTATGSFTNKSGLLTGAFTNNDGAAVTVVINKSGNTLEFVGNYSGTFTSQSGGSGTVTLTVSSNGNLNGTAVSTQNGQVTITGTVTVTGVTNITVTGQGNPDTNTGGSAISASGQLIVILFDPANNNSVTIVTLTKSAT